MKDRGVPAVAANGVIAFPDGIPPSQKDAVDLINYTCFLMFPLDPGYVEDFSEPQLRALYDYFVEAYVPCLESIRRPYPNPPPSKDVFVTRFLARGDDFMAWWPPDVITGNDARAGAACPELPPPEIFFGYEPGDSK